MATNINESIRILRNLKGFKQSYMASKMGISQQDYSYLERNGKHISEKHLSLLCEILEVNENFIRQFDNSLFFKRIQHGITDQNILNDLRISVDDEDVSVIVLKNHIITLLENIHGLRNQIKEQNQTIKELRKYFQQS